MTHRTRHDPVATMTERILGILLPYRRVLHDAGPPFATRQSCLQTLLPQQQQIRRLVQRGDPIQFTLPAFPCKSPNLNKVLGILPDMAERMSLRFLHRLCEDIGKIYPAGARMLICSDGHVFSDLIYVDDSTVCHYTTEFINMIIEENISRIDLFQLSHVYQESDFGRQRARLIADWARPLATLRQEVVCNENQKQLYRGMTRFLFEDAIPDSTLSNSALQRRCRLHALEVMQRSEAWGRLIAHHHPQTVRLSIHPQPHNSAKLGLMLLHASDNWTTPWHAVLVQQPRGAVLMKHQQARQLATLVHVNGRPSHYVMDKSQREGQSRAGTPPN